MPVDSSPPSRREGSSHPPVRFSFKDSVLDQIDLNKAIATVVMKEGEHPDKQFERMYKVRKEFRHRACQASTHEWIAQIVRGSIEPYGIHYVNAISNQDENTDGQDILDRLQALGHALYTYIASRPREQGSYSPFYGTDAKDRNRSCNQRMTCYWCGATGHKAFKCRKKKNGEPQTYNGSKATRRIGRRSVSS